MGVIRERIDWRVTLADAASTQSAGMRREIR